MMEGSLVYGSCCWTITTWLLSIQSAPNPKLLMVSPRRQITTHNGKKSDLFCAVSIRVATSRSLGRQLRHREAGSHRQVSIQNSVMKVLLSASSTKFIDRKKKTSWCQKARRQGFPTAIRIFKENACHQERMEAARRKHVCVNIVGSKKIREKL